MKYALVPASALLATFTVDAHFVKAATPVPPAPPKKISVAPTAKRRAVKTSADLVPVHPNTRLNPRLKSSGPAVKFPLPARAATSFKPRSPAVSGLGARTAPRRPARAVFTGNSNPDPASSGLADQRLRADANAPIFTLEDALALTLANNPQRREAQAAVDQATASITNAGSAGKLQVGLSGSSTYGRNTDASNAIANSQASSASSGSSGGTTGGGTTGGGTSSGSSASGPSHSFLRSDLLNVNASLPITTGGRVKASTRQARYNAIAQIYQLAQVEQDLVLSTTLGYLDVLRAEQLLRVTNSNLAVSQERLRVAQVRYSVGASARLDVLRAQTDLADARSRRIQAANQVGTASAALNTLLGRSPDVPIRVATITRLNLPAIPTSLLPPNLAVRPATGVNTPGTSANGQVTTTGRPNTNATSATGSTGTAFSGPSIGPSGGASSSPTPLGNGTVTTPGTGTATGNASTGATGTTGATSTPATATNIVPGAVGSTNNTTGAVGTTGATGTTGTTSTTATTGTTGATSATGSDAASMGAGLQSLASTSRQSLAVTQAQIGAAEAAIEVAKSGKRPQLGLNIGALLRNPATFLGNFGASIGLGLAQNLFDSRRTSSQVAEARAALEQLKARLAGQRLEVANAIEASLLALDSAQLRQNSSEVGVRSAQEALRVAQVGFRSGVRTTLDLADAQAALLAAETDAVNSRFDVADSQATLAAAVGIYTVEAQQAREKAIRDEREATEQARRQQEILHPVKKKRRKFLGIF